MKQGDIVRYSDPEPGEEQLTFTVVEVRGDRVLIESRDFPNARIAPQEVVKVVDVVVEMNTDALPQAARNMRS